MCSKDVRLPVHLQRAMAAEAEAAREARAKVNMNMMMMMMMIVINNLMMMMIMLVAIDASDLDIHHTVCLGFALVANHQCTMQKLKN